MNYLSLFSGIGGFELGIQQAYEDIEREHLGTKPEKEERPQGRVGVTDERGEGLCPSNGSAPLSGLRPLQQDDSQRPEKRNDFADESHEWKCVGYSEIDKYAIRIYERHFKHRNFGNIRNVKTEELPDIGLLCGGFPCQSFSIAGKRGGFEDTRGTLFFDIARIAKVKRPRLLFLENVKGLLSHDGGRTFNTIIGTLDDLGYDLQWQVLNSKNFGVPQNRERVFIIGHLRGTPRPQVFPFGEDDQDDNEMGRPIPPRPEIRRGHSEYPDGEILEARENGHIHQLKENGEESFTLTAQDKHGVYDGMKIRRLTPIECERLQGFPDGWTEGESDTQRYKCLGNAVTVNVIREIAKRLFA